MTTPAQQLLSPDLMTRLDRLDVLSRKILAGKLAGERRSKKKGQSVEFADYRVYVPGDDLRFIDWNLYARLEKLFLRLFVEEEDLALWLLLDTSASMGYGQPDKMLFAKRLGAALGYIGLVNYNRVSVVSFRSGLEAQMPNMRGRRPIQPMLEFLARLQPRGAGDLAAACRTFARTQHGKGVVVIISDLLDKGDYARALRYFDPERFDLYALQVLCPQEIDPEKGGITGDLRLRNLEDGNLAEVSIGPALLTRYKANLQAYCQHLRAQSTRHGVAYMVSDTSVPFEQLVLRYLRQRGMLG